MLRWSVYILLFLLPLVCLADETRELRLAARSGDLAETLGTSPVLVIAESHDVSFTGGDWPKPLRLGINLPNDHLQYAITWFSLALIWAVMSMMLVQRERGRIGRE